MRISIFMLFVGVYCIWEIQCEKTRVNREKEASGRHAGYLFPPPLVAPYGGTLKLLVGISIPISLTGGRILSFGSNFQFQYPLPQNASFFTHYFDNYDGRIMKRRAGNEKLQRRRRDFVEGPDETRSIFYRSLELEIERWGLNGRDCILKSICQAAESPLKDQGLVGQLLDVILTPDYRTGNGVNAPNDYEDYLRASEAGKRGNDCSLDYPECPEGFGLLDKISKLESTQSIIRWKN